MGTEMTDDTLTLGSFGGLLRKQTQDRLQTSGILAQMQIPSRNALRPRMIICETINACNADCVFCPYRQQTRKRGVMSLEVFEKVLADYGEMGGGNFSLTPMVGDVLLDPLLEKRVEMLAGHTGMIFPSVTTNLYALERHSDELIRRILGSFNRLHISIYGISPEECRELTRRDRFKQFSENIERLVKLWRESPQSCEIQVGFRLSYNHSRVKMEEFLKRLCGQVFPFTEISHYANWGNSISGQLPGDAAFLPDRVNVSLCALLLVAMQVYWDGRVSSCACCDYDVCDELFLGEVQKQSLLEIFNSERSRQVWTRHESGVLPKICRNCTFHVPIDDLHPDHLIVRKSSTSSAANQMYDEQAIYGN